MAYEKLDFHIRGIAPLLMHNSRLSDPLDPIAQEMKSISAKRKKTDGDHARLADLEWEGGIYTDDEGRLCMPGQNIEAALVAAAKLNRLGPKFKMGLLCEGLWPIEHEGPSDLKKLMADPNFRYRTSMKVQQNRVMRTRPRIPSWELTFAIHYHPDVLTPSQVAQAMRECGEFIGLGDSRPRFGRFVVV